MNQINIVILNDDINQIAELERCSHQYFKQKLLNYHLSTFHNTHDFFEMNLKSIDLLLLDIEISKSNGIEIATQVRKINKKCFICFMTEFSDYIVHSYDVHAFDCILKPVNILKLTKLFDEVLEYRAAQQSMDSKKISLNSVNGCVTLYLNQILFFEYYDNYDNLFNRVTKVETLSGHFLLKEKISSIYQKLPENEFLIPHKSFIVNMDQIKVFQQNSIIMQNDYKIPLSQKRASEARKKFNQYIHMVM